MSTELAISVSKVSKAYPLFERPWDRLRHLLTGRPAAREFKALSGVSFEVRKGESVGIIGRNGSGKSTLLQIIAGTLTPSEGEVHVSGKVAALLELGSGFNPEFTGRENVYLNGAILGCDRAQMDALFDEIATFADIGDFIDEPVKEYSSGMMMRLAFAVQVAVRPDILIVDEALSVGDIFFQQKCLRRIKELQEAGTALLFVSHDMAIVRDLCRRVLYLSGGKTAMFGDKSEAILKFLRDGMNGSSARQVASEVANDEGAHLRNALWSRDEAGLALGRKADLIAVAVEDEDGRAITQVTLGGALVFRALYRVNCNEPVDIAFALKNRHDQVINISGTFSLEARTLPVGSLCIAEMTITMAIEAGDYTFWVTLGERTEPNQGRIFDTSPWLGPIQVIWDYSDKSAPFLGMFGLPYTVQVRRVGTSGTASEHKCDG